MFYNCIIVINNSIRGIMDKVLQLIKEQNLIKSGDVVAVACSGGADSIALLHILKQYEDELDFQVIAVHVNHCIRDNAKRDENFVRNFCKKYNIRFYSFVVDVPKVARQMAVSLETAGRQARYGIFDALLQKGVADKIALAHHAYDQAETILLHLFRGSGLNGVIGMEVKKNNNYIRPMLNVTKDEVYEYLKQNELSFVEDETNKENTYTRNFLRNEIIPKLKEKWPNIVNTLINFGKMAAIDNEYIENNLNADALIVSGNTAKIPLSYFSYHVAIIGRILFKAFNSIGVTCDIEKKHIDSIIKLAQKSENGKKLDLPMSVSVYKEYDYITITNKKKEQVPFYAEFKSGEIIVPNFGKLNVKRVKEINNQTNALFIDLKKLPQDAYWRFRHDGDMFTKFGGGTKKLKSFLIDKKIPQRERDFIPVLASNNEVYVVGGIEISELVKVDNKSKSIMKIEVDNN